MRRSPNPNVRGLAWCGLLAAVAMWTSAADAAAPVAAEPRLISAGESIARRNCAECHTLDAAKASPLSDAPSFPSLRQRFGRDAMAQIIHERMEVIHPRMPKLQLDEDEIVEFLKYWEGLTPLPAQRRPHP